MSLNVIQVSTALALGLAAARLAVDLLAWGIVAAMFDRERLVTGTRGWLSPPRRRASSGTRRRTGGDQQCPQR